MRCKQSITIFIILGLLLPTVTIATQASNESTAEVSILTSGQLPIIRPNQDNFIYLKFDDTFGINWTRLQNYLPPSLFFLKGTKIGKAISFILTQVIWGNFIHRSWKPFLGYSKILISAEIDGNKPGWSVSISPNTIAQSTDGKTADLTLKVNVEDTAVDNTVIVRIKATRFLKDNSEYGTSYFDIPLRSTSLDYVEIRPIEQIKTISPGSVATYQIEIKNLGYFKDTFQIRLNETDRIKGGVTTQALVLDAGEAKVITAYLIAKDILYDPGTTHIINISVASSTNPRDKFYGRVQIRTQGVYISDVMYVAAAALFIILACIYALYTVMIKKREEERFGPKPTKPWKIPEEQAHLNELKKSDPAAYEQERIMMEQEYKSALDWYRSYKESMKQELKRSQLSKPGFLSRKQKEPTATKTIVSKKKKETKPAKEAIPVEKQAEHTSDTDQKKEKILEKIKREQEKQKKFF
ncbi:MAG: hypothetical protein QXX20_04520 [Candidatus Thermoplasmatota archaeon]